MLLPLASIKASLLSYLFDIISGISNTQIRLHGIGKRKDIKFYSLLVSCRVHIKFKGKTFFADRKIMKRVKLVLKRKSHRRSGP